MRIRGLTTTLVALGVAAAMALAAPVVMASDGERSSDEVSRITRQVSQEIYSPYCPGQTLAMCPSSHASYARQDIQEMAEDGMGVEEIKEVLLDRYGAKYELVEPSERDQTALLGGIVGGLVVAAMAVLLLTRRRLTSSEESDIHRDYADEIDDEDDELLLEELRAEYDDWSGE